MRALILSLIVLSQVPAWGADYWSVHDGEIFAPRKALLENYKKTYARFEKGQCGLLVDAVEESNVVRLIFVDNVFKKGSNCLSRGVVFGTFTCGRNSGSFELSTSVCHNEERSIRIYIGSSGDLSVYLPEQQVVFAKSFYRLK